MLIVLILNKNVNIMMKTSLISKLLVLSLAVVPLISNGQGCSDVFISEYMDGPNKDKVIEIYNPSDQPIDLSTYSIKVFNNGAPTPLEIPLSGTLQSEETYVVSHPQADPAILLKADQTSVKMNFDGNDAVVLNKGQSTYIDKIGEIGVNPGQAGWNLQPTGSTKGQDLRRKFPVDQGETDWVQGQNQWEVMPAMAIDNIKDHTNTCNASTQLEVAFVLQNSSYAENHSDDGITIDLEVTINEDHFDNVNVAITAFSGACPNQQTADILDYTIWDIQVDFPSHDVNSKFVNIELTNDTDNEGDEIICLGLTTGDAFVTFGKEYHELTIVDDDLMAIEEYNLLAGIKVYPTKVTNLINLEVNDLTKEYLISIIDNQGKVIMSQRSENNTYQNINISELASGIYTIRVLDKQNKSQFISKFVKD